MKAKNKANEKLKAVKNWLRSYLPGKITNAVSSYDEFTSTKAPDDAKGFSAHHAACKSAIAHTDMLVKLAKWVDDNSEEPSEEDKRQQIKDMIDRARDALNDEDVSG